MPGLLPILPTSEYNLPFIDFVLFLFAFPGLNLNRMRAKAVLILERTKNRSDWNEKESMQGNLHDLSF